MVHALAQRKCKDNTLIKRMEIADARNRAANERKLVPYSERQPYTLKRKQKPV